MMGETPASPLGNACNRLRLLLASVKRLKPHYSLSLHQIIAYGIGNLDNICSAMPPTASDLRSLQILVDHILISAF